MKKYIYFIISLLLFSTTFSIAKADKNIVIWDIRNNSSKEELEEFDKVEKILKNNRFYQILKSWENKQCYFAINKRKCIQRSNPRSIEKWEVQEICRDSKMINKFAPQIPNTFGLMNAKNLYDSLNYLEEYLYDELELNKDEINELSKQSKLMEFAKMECPEEISNE